MSNIWNRNYLFCSCIIFDIRTLIRKKKEIFPYNSLFFIEKNAFCAKVRGAENKKQGFFHAEN